MSRRTDRITTYLGTCPTTGKRMHESAARAKKAARKTGKGLHSYLCPDCGRYHVGHQGSQSTREDMRDRRRDPAERARALAEVYEAMPTTENWNALMKALRVPADHLPFYRNGSGDPTAEAAIARVDREKRK